MSSDHVKMLDCVVASETVERDRRLLTGVVTVSVVYGELAVRIAVPFAARATHADAIRWALQQVENMGHFMETYARVARLEYGCAP